MYFPNQKVGEGLPPLFLIMKIIFYLTPGPQVKRLVSLRLNEKWVEIYKGEVVLCNKHWRDVLINSYGFIECDEPPVYATIEEALENSLNSYRHLT